MGARLWAIADAVMLLAFVFSVAVQWNDPDPLAWVAVYGLAALACILAILRRLPWLLPAVIAIVAAVWAGTIAPRVLGHVRFADMFGAFEMADVGIEESREMYGLLIVAVWMLVLVVRQLRRRSAKRA